MRAIATLCTVPIVTALVLAAIIIVFLEYGTTAVAPVDTGPPWESMRRTQP